VYFYGSNWFHNNLVLSYYRTFIDCFFLSRWCSQHSRKWIFNHKLSKFWSLNRGGPRSAPSLFMWDLWWTKWKWTGLSSSPSVFPYYYHPTLVPYSSSAYSQKGKQAEPHIYDVWEPDNFQNCNPLSERGKQWLGSSAFLVNFLQTYWRQLSLYSVSTCLSSLLSFNSARYREAFSVPWLIQLKTCTEIKGNGLWLAPRTGLLDEAVSMSEEDNLGLAKSCCSRLLRYSIFDSLNWKSLNSVCWAEFSYLVRHIIDSWAVCSKFAKCTYKRNIEARSHNEFCSGQAINIIYPECLSVALIILHSKCMRIIILSSATYQILPHSYTLWQIDKIFQKKKVPERKMYFDFPSNFCLKYFLFWGELSEIIS